MTDPDELGRAIGAVADALDAIGSRWAIGGSIASAVHGEPRATNDVDVVATLDESRRATSALDWAPNFTLMRIPQPTPRVVAAAST